jgi:hypothetical protein
MLVTMIRCSVGAIVLAIYCLARADVAVLTQHNDLSRTGANLNETVLNTNNVNTNQFGLVFSCPVDDQIYAQPLIATQVNLGGKGTHNLVIVATVNDSVYAFDADNPSVSAPYWQTSFLSANVVPPTTSDLGAEGTFSGNVGIVGTPVIDPSSGTLYVVARTKENGTSFFQRLHALDIATGAERAGSPVVISASVSGTNSFDGQSGTVTFNSVQENQRAGLALVNGIVYICWGSQFDIEPYHGWVIGYNAQTLAQVAVFNTTPNGREGSVWMSGAAPSADSSGNLYLTIANGPTNNTTTPTTNGNLVESFVQLTPNGSALSISSYFTAAEWQSLDVNDVDLGSSGLLLIPNTTLAFSGGKDGMAYLVNRNSMGGLNSTNEVVQSFSILSPISAGQGELHGTPVWWDGPAGSYAYVWPSYDYLQQYQFNSNGVFTLPALAESPTPAPATGQPGGILSLSANGSAAGSGILWASHQLTGDASTATEPGILHAYNAQNVSQELWNSQQLPARDAVGNFAKYVPPTVANGKVYLATFSNQLKVYGLLNATSPPPAGGSNWVQTVNFRLTAWENGTVAPFSISTKMIISSLSGLATNASGSPVTFSAEAQLLCKQPLSDSGGAGVSYAVLDGKPAVQTDVTAFFQHSVVSSVTFSTASHIAGHNIESFSLVNDPAINFTLQGFAAPTSANLRKSGNFVMGAYSADVSGVGQMPSHSSSPIVIRGTVSLSGGKLE